MMKYTFIIFAFCINPLFSQDWNMKLDTINLENIRENVFKSLIKEVENQQSTVISCPPSYIWAPHLLECQLENLQLEYANDRIRGNVGLEFNKQVLERVLRFNSKKEIFAIYIINFAHPKHKTFSDYDYIVITETLKGYDIFNISNEVKRNFKKRVKKNEFYWNFEYFFNTIQSKGNYEMTCFAGAHSIKITKIYKEKMDDTFLSFKSAINLIPACQEESFLEYILGFKNHLNPQKYK